MDVLEGILDRIDRGTTTMGDGVALRLIVEEMKQDIANLTTIIEKEADTNEQGTCEGLPVGTLSA